MRTPIIQLCFVALGWILLANACGKEDDADEPFTAASGGTRATGGNGGRASAGRASGGAGGRSNATGGTGRSRTSTGTGTGFGTLTSLGTLTFTR